LKLSNTAWVFITIAAVLFVLHKTLTPAGFSGLNSQRGIFGTGTGLYNGMGQNKVPDTGILSS
jgi:hypothetical protein